MIIDEEGQKIEWQDMPRSLMMNIEQDFHMVKSYPLMHINMVLAEQLESI